MYGGGKGFGTVVDSTGRAAVKLGFPTGSLRLERLEKMREGVFGFKELKPWATKSADGAWRPIEAADMVGDHAWARHKFMLRRRGFTDAKLRAETQQSIYNTMSGVYRKRDREIIASLAEALGAGGLRPYSTTPPTRSPGGISRRGQTTCLGPRLRRRAAAWLAVRGPELLRAERNSRRCGTRSDLLEKRLPPARRLGVPPGA